MTQQLEQVRDTIPVGSVDPLKQAVLQILQASPLFQQFGYCEDRGDIFPKPSLLSRQLQEDSARILNGLVDESLRIKEEDIRAGSGSGDETAQLLALEGLVGQSVDNDEDLQGLPEIPDWSKYK